MSNIQLHKLNACKFDYEFMGKSPEELSLTYGFPVHMVKEEIASKAWQRKIAPTELPDTKDVLAFAEALERTTRAKLGIISLFRQIEQQPLIAALEKEFLQKALDLASDLTSMDDRAATKLVNLVKAVALLQDRNPIDLADQVKDSIKNNGGQVIVNIANQVQ